MEGGIGKHKAVSGQGNSLRFQGDKSFGFSVWACVGKLGLVTAKEGPDSVWKPGRKPAHCCQECRAAEILGPSVSILGRGAFRGKPATLSKNQAR